MPDVDVCETSIKHTRSRMGYLLLQEKRGILLHRILPFTSDRDYPFEIGAALRGLRLHYSRLTNVNIY